MSTLDIQIPYNWNLQELNAFCAVCEARSLTRAALALQMPQPALSLMVRRWREALSDPLFIRSRYGVTPTEHALALRRRIAPALSELGRSLNEVEEFRPEQSSRMFRLHMSDIGQLVFLPRLTTFFHASAANARLHIQHLPWEGVQEALSNGTIDIALGALPMIKGRVHSRLVRREPFVTVMRKNHALARGRLDLAAFARASHLVIDAPSSGHTLVESVLRAKGVHRRVGMTVSHYLAVEQILANCDYLLTVPEVAVLAFHDPAVHHIVPAPISLPTFDIRLHWHERARSDPGVQWLRANMVKLYAR